MIKSILAKLLRGVFFSCIWLAACAPPAPESRLILGSSSERPALGPRKLTSSQTRALKEVITAGGGLCTDMSDVYLRDVAPGGESWDVRCAEAAYSVKVADVGMAMVRPCREGPLGGEPCASGPFERDRSGRPASGELNPDLGKLLEPMTAKSGKTD